MVTEDGIIAARDKYTAVVERFTLDNGVRVIAEEIPWVASASIGFFVPAGSAYESRKLSGISHFLEHMVFKGTRGRTARDIVMDIESLGGVMNAATGKEFTSYHARIYYEHLGSAADVLADLVFNPLIPESDLAREKSVVIEEIKMGEDNPDEFITDNFYLRVFGNTPLGRKIAGTPGTVSSFSRKDLKEYHSKHYRPCDVVISVAGKLHLDELPGLLEKEFKARKIWKKPERRGRGLPKVKPRFRNPKFILRKDVEQTTLILGFPSVSVYDPDRYGLAILDAHLSGGMSSRLFQEVREKRGLVYSIDSTQSSLSSCGLYMIDAGMAGENATEVAKVVAKELKRVTQRKLSKKELGNAREYLKGVMFLGLENSTARMNRNAVCEIYHNRYIPLEELMDILDGITSEDIQRIAQRVFDPGKLALGLLTSDEHEKGDGLLESVCAKIDLG